MRAARQATLGRLAAMLPEERSRNHWIREAQGDGAASGPKPSRRQPGAGGAVTAATMLSRTQTISVPDWSTAW